MTSMEVVMRASGTSKLPPRAGYASGRIVKMMVLAVAMVGGFGCDGGLSGREVAPSGGSDARQGPWVEGIHYARIESDDSDVSSMRNEIVEIFSYDCQVCYTFEPTLVLWERHLSQERGLKLVRVPLTGKAETYRYSHLFFTLRALGRDDLHAVIYDTIHRGRGVLVSQQGNEETLRLQTEFAKKYGIPQEKFVETYTSAQVREQVAEAQRLTRKFLVARTPTIVIGRKYKTDIHDAGGERYVLAMALDLATGFR